MLVRRSALLLILSSVGMLCLATTGVRVATAQRASLRALSLYHPNLRNYCADIGYKHYAPVTIPDAPHRTRTCKELTVRALGSYAFMLHCSSGQGTMHWWGFYPDKPINHGFISINHFKTITNSSGHVIGLDLNIISSALYDITFWAWIDCGPH